MESWELRPTVFVPDRDAAKYRVRFGDERPGNPDLQANARRLWGATYERGASRAFLRTNTSLRHADGDWSTGTNVYEGYITHRPTPNLTVDAGKRTMKWGKGYAWNPVAFLDRPKNPEDPELAQEGFVVASADYIRSFDGPLTTFAFTPVLVPVLWDVNERFGRRDTVSVAGKAYFLYHDTDIDLMFLAGAGRRPRYGVDFSRNLTPNFEVHGEFAWLNGSTRPVVDPSGTIAAMETDARSRLLGLRYLTTSNVTWIVENYHNGAGYRPREMRDYFAFVDRAFADDTGEDSMRRQVRQLSEGGYGYQNAMRDYLYVRASQPDDWVSSTSHPRS